jgi:hypothetical protein
VGVIVKVAMVVIVVMRVGMVPIFRVFEAKKFVSHVD